jgi:hypothetical protein
VFAGETLQRGVAAELIPEVLLHPPARRGDLLGVAGPGDVVVIIDGDPHHPPRHDEILSLLASGVAVAGAGGLGAVLAADIWEVPEADLGVAALDRGFDSPASALRGLP